MRIGTLYISALAAIITGCGEAADSTIGFETITVDQTVALSNDAVPPKCSVHLALKEARPDNGHTAEVVNGIVARELLDADDAPDLSLSQAARTFAEAYTQNYRKTMLPLYNQDRGDTTKRAWYEYHYIVKTETHGGSKGTTDYLADIDYYEGGAHSVQQRRAFVFDNLTGRRLTLADVFIPGSKQALNARLVQALKNKTGLATMAALRAKGYLTASEMYATENFMLTEETITFIYNPYEIAPYALGSTELTIPYSDLTNILNPNFKY